MASYDFGGYATRNNLKCADGRIILKDAFKDCDGKVVPLVWNHLHEGPENVLGHALLENREDGVYAYCTLNDSEKGRDTKEIVKHGDVTQLSIYANKLKQKGPSVFHGIIREVSVVLAGANPGATIDSVIMHSEDGYDEEAIINTGEGFGIDLMHSADDKKKKAEEEAERIDEVVEETKPEDAPKATDNSTEKEKDMADEETKNDKTVQDVVDSMTEEQKNVMYALIGAAIEDAQGGDNDEEDDDVKHNVFESDYEQGDYLTHSDEEAIINMAKASQVGSFQAAMEIFAEENGLQHDALASGFVQTGVGNVTNLFPDYKEVRPGAPELVTDDQGWITTVMNKVHKSPISRIRTSQVDIRNIDTIRAKGYKKGKQKAQSGNFQLIRRTTDPQTVYVKSALHRDDIVDITDFDYVQYLYNIDRLMLNEELATAIMIGDGRLDGDDAKIAEDKIRPIWTDDDLYTIHTDIDKTNIQGTDTDANFGDNYVMAEAMVNAALYARENYRGSGTPDMYVTPHMLNVMLLARDLNGRRIYGTKAELASALNVGDIHTVEKFEGKTRTTSDSKTKKLLAMIVNLADYSLGATKGGEITHFTQFDIDFNQQKSLIETRCSGALTRVYSAIAIEEDVTESSNP